MRKKVRDSEGESAKGRLRLVKIGELCTEHGYWSDDFEESFGPAAVGCAYYCLIVGNGQHIQVLDHLTAHWWEDVHPEVKAWLVKESDELNWPVEGSEDERSFRLARRFVSDWLDSFVWREVDEHLQDVADDGTRGAYCGRNVNRIERKSIQRIPEGLQVLHPALQDEYECF